MPFFRQIQNEIGTLNIWKLTEKPAELYGQSSLTAEDEKRYAAISSEKRQTEFLATRLLLRNLFDYTPEINYNQWGKPFLKNRNENISISHSADFAVVFVSEKKIGIDIELETRNIDRVCKRFLHPEEMAFLSTAKNQQRGKITCWSAKEAIFKCSDVHGIQFNEQILINSFDVDKDHVFSAKLVVSNQNTHYQLQSLFFENNVLIYCVEL